MRNQLDFGFQIHNQSIENVEIRPGWDNPAEMMERSFAAIVAAHVARGELSLRLQGCVATLYFLTSLLFFWLYMQASFEVAAHISELIKRQLIPSTGSRWVIVPRLLVWFIGTVVTLWFICRKEDIADVDQPESKDSQQS